MVHGYGGYTEGCRCEICRAGSREYRRQYRLAHLEEARRKDRERYHAKRKPRTDEEKAQVRARRRELKYGITQEEFDARLKEQGGRCKICREIPTGEWHLDEDHETGEIRGILCSRCNMGLGLFRDSEEFLMVAIEYLRASRDLPILR